LRLKIFYNIFMFQENQWIRLISASVNVNVMESKIKIKELSKYVVKPMLADHPRDTKVVVVVDRWSLFRGSFM